MIGAVQVATAFDGVAIKVVRNSDGVSLWEDGEVVVGDRPLISMADARDWAFERSTERYLRAVDTSVKLGLSLPNDPGLGWRTIL